MLILKQLMLTIERLLPTTRCYKVIDKELEHMSGSEICCTRSKAIERRVHVTLRQRYIAYLFCGMKHRGSGPSMDCLAQTVDRALSGQTVDRLRKAWIKLAQSVDTPGTNCG